MKSLEYPGPFSDSNSIPKSVYASLRLAGSLLYLNLIPRPSQPPKKATNFFLIVLQMRTIQSSPSCTRATGITHCHTRMGAEPWKERTIHQKRREFQKVLRRVEGGPSEPHRMRFGDLSSSMAVLLRMLRKCVELVRLALGTTIGSRRQYR